MRSTTTLSVKSDSHMNQLLASLKCKNNTESLKLSWSGDGNVALGPTKMLIHAHVLLGEITLSPKHCIHKRPEHPHAISTQGKLWCYGCGCVGFLLMPLVHPSVKHAGCTQLITFVCRFYFFPANSCETTEIRLIMSIQTFLVQNNNNNFQPREVGVGTLW